MTRAVALRRRARGDFIVGPGPRKPTVERVVGDLFGAPLRDDSRFPGWGKHEGTLAGVNATFDWAAGARPGPVPNRDDNAGFEGVNYRFHNIWGQVIPASPSAGNRAVRVYVRWPRVYHLASGANTWTQVRGTPADLKNFEGGYWSGDTYAKVTTMTEGTHWRREAEGHSFTVSPMTDAALGPSAQPIAHWFYSGLYPRVEIPEGTRVAIHAQMRLIEGDPAAARYLAAFSGDLYTGADTNVGANGRNPPLAIPRHRLLTAQWTSLSYVSGTEDEIRNGPVPPFATVAGGVAP